jgi:hypothetical protein
VWNFSFNELVLMGVILFFVLTANRVGKLGAKVALLLSGTKAEGSAGSDDEHP